MKKEFQNSLNERMLSFNTHYAYNHKLGKTNQDYRKEILELEDRYKRSLSFQLFLLKKLKKYQEKEGLPQKWQQSTPSILAYQQTKQNQIIFDRKGISSPLNLIAQLKESALGGYSSYALQELKYYCEDTDAEIEIRKEAAWALADCFCRQENYPLAYSYIQKNLAPTNYEMASHFCLDQACLLKLKRADKVLENFRNQFDRFKKNNIALLLYSTAQRDEMLRSGKDIHDVEVEQLKYINMIFENNLLAKIAIRNTSIPLSLDNIFSPDTKELIIDGPKISVIMPAYNSEQTIESSILSILEQTWKNLELIIVDDCSNDKTCEIINKYSKIDARVIPLYLSTNAGAYPARNEGLKIATGEFIMVQDSDDWSHPQKIETLATMLLNNSSCVATMSYWVRVDSELRWIGEKKLVQHANLDFTSFLIYKKILCDVGGWDNVRVSGDAELRWRIIKLYGDNSVGNINASKVLAFGRVRSDSLTRSVKTALSTLDEYSGLRGIYKSSYDYWHRTAINAGESLHIDKKNFITPLSNIIKNSSESYERFDVIVISDFTLTGDAAVSHITYVQALHKLGKKIALFHWKKYDLDSKNLICDSFFELCYRHKIDIICSTDKVKTELVIFTYVQSLLYVPDTLPEIEAKHSIVLVDRYPERLTTGEDIVYSPYIIQENIVAAFSLSNNPVWIPTSDWVAALMKKSFPQLNIHFQIWYPLPDCQAWTPKSIHWRGDLRTHPVIGIHGRKRGPEWASAASLVTSAYASDTNTDTLLMGDVNKTIDQFYSPSKNWTTFKYNEAPAKEFFEKIDFLVHFPHEDVHEALRMVVIEAMACGKVAILPYQFELAFGDAAVYCDYGKVEETIIQYWSDEELYTSQAVAGKKFILSSWGAEAVNERLSVILNSHDG